VRKVTTEGAALNLDGRRIPLLSGEMHFWRMDPSDWEPALEAMVAEKIPIVSTYLSWRRHAPGVQEIDFTSPHLNVRRFLQLCTDKGLLVHLKPGPWICAEEPGGGYPDWLLADRALWALDASDTPIMGYNPPFKHPVPSYLHPRYLAYVRDWLQAVDDHLRDFFYPGGSIILVQLDNEPSYCFQDSMYGADYHPVAITVFRRWVVRRYGSLKGVERAWNVPVRTEEDVTPPRASSGNTASIPGMRMWQREHDWVQFKEWMLAEYLRRLRTYHKAAGASGVMFTLNYNTHSVHTVPQAASGLQQAVHGLGGEDMYYIPPLRLHHLVPLVRSAATAYANGEVLPWVPEIQAGIWRSPGEHPDYPDPTPEQQALYYIAALACGFKGLNFYMLVERENWDLAPLGRNGSYTAMLGAVRQSVALLKRLLEVDALRPVHTVALLWYRPHAREAYIVAGAADVAVDGRGATYATWEAAFAALVQSGYFPAIWNTDMLEPPQGTRAMVVPGCMFLSRVVQDRLLSLARRGMIISLVGTPPQLDEDGRPYSSLAEGIMSKQPGLMQVDSLKDLTTALVMAGVSPAVACDHPEAVAVLQQGSGRTFLFLLYCGNRHTLVELNLPAIPTGIFREMLSLENSVPLIQGTARFFVEPWSATVHELIETDKECGV
jgi:hypothetical protein